MNRHVFLMEKKCLQTCAKCADSDHPATAQSIIRAFALHSYSVWYPIMLLADTKSPDQTARMRRLILAFAVRACSEGIFSLGATQVILDIVRANIARSCHRIVVALSHPHIHTIIRKIKTLSVTLFRSCSRPQGQYDFYIRKTCR